MLKRSQPAQGLLAPLANLKSNITFTMPLQTITHGIAFAMGVDTNDALQKRSGITSSATETFYKDITHMSAIIT